MPGNIFYVSDLEGFHCLVQTRGDEHEFGNPRRTFSPQDEVKGGSEVKQGLVTGQAKLEEASEGHVFSQISRYILTRRAPPLPLSARLPASA